MSVRRKIDGSGRRRITVIEDETELDSNHLGHEMATAEAAEEEHVTETAHAGPLQLARGVSGMVTLWVGIALAVVETLLLFRLGFALGGANPANNFVEFIFDVTGPLVGPFQGIFAERGVNGGRLFEPETLIAMLVWAALAALVIAMVWASTAFPASSTRHSVVTRERHGHFRRD